MHASKVGAEIELDQLPINDHVKQLQQESQWQYALAGGDDYELCFTISPQNYQKLLQLELDVNIHKIGQITEPLGLRYKNYGVDHILKFQGYQHFA